MQCSVDEIASAQFLTMRRGSEGSSFSYLFQYFGDTFGRFVFTDCVRPGILKCVCVSTFFDTEPSSTHLQTHNQQKHLDMGWLLPMHMVPVRKDHAVPSGWVQFVIRWCIGIETPTLLTRQPPKHRNSRWVSAHPIETLMWVGLLNVRPQRGQANGT